MKHYWVFALVVTVALGVSVVLLPRDRELRVMNLKGQRYEQARIEFENQVDRGDLSVATVMPLVDIYKHFGEIEKSVQLLERFVSENPQNSSALRILSNLYSDAMRPADQIATLEAIQRIHPASAHLRELVDLYSLHGPYGKKIAALETLVRERWATSEETLEVAFHNASHGKPEKALEILSLSGVHPLSMEVEELRADLLLDLGEKDQARATAVKWLKHNFDTASLDRMLHLFNNRGEPGEALKILANFEANIASHPHLLLLRAQLEMAGGQNDRAIAQVQELNREGHLSGDDFTGLMTRAVKARRGEFALRLAREAAPDNLEGKNIAVIAETALREGQPEVMQPLLVRYGETALLSRPVLAGHLKGRLGGLSSARKGPNPLPANWKRDLETTLDLARWHADEDSKSLTRLPGKKNVIDALLEHLDSGQLSDAQKLNVLSTLAHLQVTTALLPHLEPLAMEQGGPWAKLYEETLVRLGGETGRRKLDLFRARQDTTPIETKRSIARRFIEEEKNKDAEEILRMLAEAALPESEDVRALITLWSRPLAEENLAWLIDRARQSTGETQAGWMRHLNEVGAASEVVHLLGDTLPENDAVFDRYLEALAALRDGPRLGQAIEARLNGPIAGDRWFTYGTWAEGLDQFQVARRVFRKLIQSEPGRTAPLRNLGAIAYHEGHWTEVVDTLGPFLQKEKGDWKSYYYFAEANHFLGHSFEAQKYSLHALERIDGEAEWSLPMRVARAYCLKRLNRKEEAITAFRELLEKETGNGALRSSLTAALGELGDPARPAVY